MKKTFGLNSKFKHKFGSLGSVPSNIVDIDELIVHLDASNPLSYSGSGGLVSSGTTWTNISRNAWPQVAGNASVKNGSRYRNNLVKSFLFDGYDDYVGIRETGSLFHHRPGVTGNNEITIEAWVRTTNTNGHLVSRPWNNNGEYSYRVFHNGITSNTDRNNSRTLNFTSYATGNWEHVVIVISPTQWGVYRNGVVDVPMTNHNLTANLPTTSNQGWGGADYWPPLTIMTVYPYSWPNDGWSGGGPNLGTLGELNSFRLYRKVLTAEQIAQNYNATKSRFENTQLILDLDASNVASYSGSGNTWSDLSLNAFQGTIGAGSTFSADGGGSIELNGNQYITVSDSDQWELHNFTINFWFKRTVDFPLTQGWRQSLLAQDVGPGSVPKFTYFYDRTNSRVTFQILETTYNFSLSNPAINTWHNWQLTKNDNTITFYANGQLIGTASTTNYIPNISAPLTIGWAEGASPYFQGKIGKVSIHDYAKTTQQIQQDYDATKSRFQSIVLDLDASNVASYPGSGNTWSDLSLNAFQATIGAGATFSTDGGGSIELNGNQYIEIPDSNVFQFGDFSMSVWFKRSASWINQFWTDILIGQDEGPGPYNKWFLTYDVQAQKPVLGITPPIYNSADYPKSTSTFPLNNNVWYNLVVTKQNNTISFYGNGNFLGSTTGYSIPNVAAPLRIGYGEYNTDGTGSKPYFRGKIGKVSIHDYAKTTQQIQQDYNATKGRFEKIVSSGLIMHVDASNSSSYSGSGTTITDLSGTGNNGTIYGNMTHDGSNFVFNGNGGFSHPNVMQNECTYSFWLINTAPSQNYATYFKHKNDPFSTNVPLAHGQSEGCYMEILGPGSGANKKLWFVLFATESGQFVGHNRAAVDWEFNTWKNITVSWGGATKRLKLYYNGQLIDNQPYAGNVMLPTSPTQYFGTAYNPGTPEDTGYRGKLNMFAAYNRVLTDAEVLQNFNSLRGRFNI